jgi:hypothetical protein
MLLVWLGSFPSRPRNNPYAFVALGQNLGPLVGLTVRASCGKADAGLAGVANDHLRYSVVDVPIMRIFAHE